MNQLLFVALGGALGAMARFGVATSTTALLGKSFPYGTLFVNVIGGFFMGVALILMQEKGVFNIQTQALVIIGFFGAFTTFSAFSIDAIELIAAGKIINALNYILLSVFASIGATYLGILLTRQN